MIFFPILKKNPNLHFFCFEDWDFHSINTHTSYLVTFSFNLMETACVVAEFVFLLTKNEIIVHYNKFPNLGVYHATFPNLKGPRGPFPKLQKNPCGLLHINVRLALSSNVRVREYFTLH